MFKMPCLFIILILLFVGCSTIPEQKPEPLNLDKKIYQLDIGPSYFFSQKSKDSQTQAHSPGFNIGMTTLLLNNEKLEEHVVMYWDVKYSHFFNSNIISEENGELYQNNRTQKLRFSAGFCSKSFINLRLCMPLIGVTSHWIHTNKNFQRTTRGYLIFFDKNTKLGGAIGLENIPLKIEFLALKPLHTFWLEVDSVAGFTSSVFATPKNHEIRLGYSYSFYD